MAALDLLLGRARIAQKTIVLPEGQDPRVVVAANRALEIGAAKRVIVLGSEAEISAACAEGGVSERKFETIDYLAHDDFNKFVEEFTEMRKSKGMTTEKATAMMQSRIYYGSMMVRHGQADGLVAGSIASTGDMLRAAFHCIGTEPGIKCASSCFVMDLKEPTPSGDELLIFSDCAVNPVPTAEQLVDIAIAASESMENLFGKQPRVAFLSFSSKGSSNHEAVLKVREAAEALQAKIQAENLNIVCEGELQSDAAIIPVVASAKAPGSEVAGTANVLIFPDLNAGNIAYKLVQRLANADAYGPVLQGLAQPLNDLSRGCSADDIVAEIAITSCQAH